MHHFSIFRGSNFNLSNVTVNHDGPSVEVFRLDLDFGENTADSKLITSET